MKKNKTIGGLLIITAIMMVLGIIINHHILWSVIDIFAILVNLGSGLFIFFRKH